MSDQVSKPQTRGIYDWAKALVTDSPHARVAFWRGATVSMLVPGVIEVIIGDSLATGAHFTSAAIFALIGLLYWYKNEIVPEPDAKTAEEIKQ